MSSVDDAGPGETVGGVKMPTKADLNLPQDKRFAQALEASQSSSYLQGMVDTLRSNASLITDPKERERVLTEAFNKEIEARGLSRKARILQTGTFQGAVAGAGLGAATAAGLGTTVGTLVGGVVGIPTTAVGGLVGTGVGAFHGPWISLSKKDQQGKTDKTGKTEETPKVDQAGKIDQTINMDQPDKTEQPDKANQASKTDQAGKPEQTRRKPPKLQQRSQAETAPKRKPPKLEVRSKAKSDEAKKTSTGS